MRLLVDGVGVGPIKTLQAPLSFWGGVDVSNGRIIDKNHPQHGESVQGAILSLPHGRGSSSSATVLAEMIRLRTGPVGLLLGEPDEILIAGAFVANALYKVGFVVAVGFPPDDPSGRYQLDATGLFPIDKQS